MARSAEFKIKIEGDFAMTKAELYKKLKVWLEHNGHTSASFGFTFQELSYLGEED